MNFHWPFVRKPAHTEVRYVVPTAQEKRAASRAEANRRASINAQLAVYAACTTPEQRRRDTEAFIAKARAEASSQRTAFIAAAKNGGRG